MLARLWIILAGLVFGAIGAYAVNLGNPPNMGLCVAGFLSDIVGALNLHHVSMMQYIRPEIIGFLLGSLVSSLAFREWRVRGGASPFIRFFLGFFLMTGALVFLGCPIRMVLRIAGGDLNGVVGLLGLVSGCGVSVIFMRKGFSLGQAKRLPRPAGLILPSVMLVLLGLAIVKPGFVTFSTSGPASMHAPLFIALGFGVLAGFMAQRTRMCSIGAWRDLLLIGDTYLFSGIAALFIGALVTNFAVGNFSSIYHWGVTGEPFAHNDFLWNYLSMGLVGMAATMIGACPFRNLVLSGEGDLDAGAVVAGLVVGAVFANNVGVTSSPDGVSMWGPAAVLTGLAFCTTLGFVARVRHANRVRRSHVSNTVRSAQ